MNKALLAYLESVGAGAAVAALAAAYEALSKQGGGPIIWQPVLAAGLMGAMAYAISALRWLQTPPAPPVPPSAIPAVPVPVVPVVPAPAPPAPAAPVLSPQTAKTAAAVPSPVGGTVLPPAAG